MNSDDCVNMFKMGIYKYMCLEIRRSKWLKSNKCKRARKDDKDG
jgi:hypothetical protein